MNGKGGYPGRARSGFIQKPVFDDEAASRRQMSERLSHERRVGIRTLVVQDVRHQHDIIGPAQGVGVEVSSQQGDPRVKSRFLDRPLGRLQRLRQVKDGRAQPRVDGAKGDRIRAGTSPEIKEGPRFAKLQPRGQRRPALLSDAIQNRQHVRPQLRIGFKHMAGHRRVSGSDRLLQLAPVAPLRLMEQEQVSHIARRSLGQMGPRHLGIAEPVGLFGQHPHRRQGVHQQPERTFIRSDPLSHLGDGELLPSQHRKQIQLHRGEEDLRLPVVAQLEDLGERQVSRHTDPRCAGVGASACLRR